MSTVTIPRELNREVKSFIVRTINEILNDPDFGSELSAQAQKRLRRALISKQKTTSFTEIKNRRLASDL